MEHIPMIIAVALGTGIAFLVVYAIWDDVRRSLDRWGDP